MSVFIRFLVVLLAVASALGLRFGSNVQSRRFATSTRLFAATTEPNTLAAYEAVKQQAIGTLKAKAAAGESPEYFANIMADFLEEYATSNLEAKESAESFKNNVFTFLKSVQQAISDPHKFQPFHAAIRQPFDYYKWGNDFLRPLIILEKSKMEGVANLKKIEDILAKGENVVILSNHQTEADPQVISVLLEKYGMSSLAEKVIFIAGHKVTNDPVAIPFSMGRNLVCIHSKKHIKNPPEDIPKKQAQNLASMKAMGDLFTEGGKIFWVAPSGGRDRPDESGKFVVAPFDVKVVDTFYLVQRQSGRPMHFFPMAMYTHTLVPPPKTVSSTLGEARSAKRGAVSVYLLDEVPNPSGLKDKEFTADLESKVASAYKELVAFHDSQ